MLLIDSSAENANKVTTSTLPKTSGTATSALISMETFAQNATLQNALNAKEAGSQIRQAKNAWKDSTTVLTKPFLVSLSILALRTMATTNARNVSLATSGAPLRESATDVAKDVRPAKTHSLAQPALSNTTFCGTGQAAPPWSKTAPFPSQSSLPTCFKKCHYLETDYMNVLSASPATLCTTTERNARLAQVCLEVTVRTASMILWLRRGLARNVRLERFLEIITVLPRRVLISVR